MSIERYIEKSYQILYKRKWTNYLRKDKQKTKVEKRYSFIFTKGKKDQEVKILQMTKIDLNNQLRQIYQSKVYTIDHFEEKR